MAKSTLYGQARSLSRTSKSSTEKGSVNFEIFQRCLALLPAQMSHTVEHNNERTWSIEVVYKVGDGESES